MTQTDTIDEIEEKLKKPKKWCVVIHNDNVTPMEFVVQLLMLVFHHSRNTATKIMLDIHHNDKAVAGTYPREIAEQKYAEALSTVALSAQRLKLSLEEES